MSLSNTEIYILPKESSDPPVEGFEPVLRRGVLGVLKMPPFLRGFRILRELKCCSHVAHLRRFCHCSAHLLQHGDQLVSRLGKWLVWECKDGPYDM